MNTFKRLFLGSLAAFAAGAIAASASTTPDLGWLSGHWCSRPGEERIEEHWLPVRGDLMLAVGRTIKAGKTKSFEFLRIERRGAVTNFIAQPEGAPPTPFRLTASGADWARFENPTHDFPQRVEYRRTASGLHAEIAGPGEGGRERVIPFEYVPCTE